jgi:hypothetical protein
LGAPSLAAAQAVAIAAARWRRSIADQVVVDHDNVGGRQAAAGWTFAKWIEENAKRSRASYPNRPMAD